jgi:hypothetical protein
MLVILSRPVTAPAAISGSTHAVAASEAAVREGLKDGADYGDVEHCRLLSFAPPDTTAD